MKKFIAGIVILLLIIGFGAWKLFVIGKPAPDDSLAVQVEEGDGQVAIYIQCMDSGMAISNLQYQYKGTAMHLTVWTVPCSPIQNDGDTCLYYEITDETEIWVGGKLIWTAE